MTKVYPISMKFKETNMIKVRENSCFHIFMVVILIIPGPGCHACDSRIAIFFYQIPHWSLSLQGLAVMLGCRSPTPIGPPSTSHTAVDLKSYTTKLWPEVKSFTKVQSGKSQCNSLKMSGMELGMWNTGQEFVPQSESSTMMWASAWY